jgi:ariadne-1
MESDEDFMSIASSGDDFLDTQASDDESLGEGMWLFPSFFRTL